MIKFLETITVLGNDALVPIDKIKYINLIHSESNVVIRICGYDGEWEEHFPNIDTAGKRYNQIKEIIGAK